MSQTFFSKQTPDEKTSRLLRLVSSKENIIVWKKGSKNRESFKAVHFDKDRLEIEIDTGSLSFTPGDNLLATFELQGMNFFTEIKVVKSAPGYSLFKIDKTLFKSERRSSYRLLTFPLYEVFALFNVTNVKEESTVIDISSGVSTKNLFKSYLKLIEKNNSSDEFLKLRVQDLSTTGLALYVTDLEGRFLSKDQEFRDVDIQFSDEVITVPLAKIVYVVPYLSQSKKMFKVGVNFPNIAHAVDEKIGKKINELLRQIDSNKDFENFIK